MARNIRPPAVTAMLFVGRFKYKKKSWNLRTGYGSRSSYRLKYIILDCFLFPSPTALKDNFLSKLADRQTNHKPANKLRLKYNSLAAVGPKYQ